MRKCWQLIRAICLFCVCPSRCHQSICKELFPEYFQHTWLSHHIHLVKRQMIFESMQCDCKQKKNASQHFTIFRNNIDKFPRKTVYQKHLLLADKKNTALFSAYVHEHFWIINLILLAILLRIYVTWNYRLLFFAIGSPPTSLQCDKWIGNIVQACNFWCLNQEQRLIETLHEETPKIPNALESQTCLFKSWRKCE